MSDIVERLRDLLAAELPYDRKRHVITEAADEIERLEKQCEGLAQSAMNNGQALLLAEAEVARLTAALQNRTGRAWGLGLTTEEKRDENSK